MDTREEPKQCGEPMERADVYFNWNMFVDCPYCGEGLDLTDNNDDDGFLSKRIFYNKWDNLIGEEVHCHLCGKDFLIGSVEVR